MTRGNDHGRRALTATRQQRKKTLTLTQLSGIIGDIYDAALDPGLWPPFLDHTCDVLRADMAMMMWSAHEHPYDRWYIASNIDPVTLADFRHRSDLDAEFACLTTFERQKPCYSLIRLYRGSRLSAFDEVDEQFMHIVVPHIRRAIVLNCCMAEATEQSGALLAALEKSFYGVVVLDEWHQAVRLNKIAETIFQESDGLQMHCRKLLVATQSEQRELDRLIFCATSDPCAETGNFTGVLAASRPSGRLPYQIAVLPLRSRYRYFLSTGRAAAICFIHDPVTGHLPDEHFLEAFYRLTPGQSRLASRLVATGALGPAAASLGISINTAKTQLKGVFAKTGVVNQNELIRLLMRGITEPVAGNDAGSRPIEPCDSTVAAT